MNTKTYTLKSAPINENRFEDGSHYELASGLRRIAAYWLNNILLFIWVFLVLFAASFLPQGTLPDMNANQAEWLNILIFLLPIILFIALQIWFIHRYGQTIGKRIMRIQAVDSHTGQTIPTLKYVVTRELWIYLLSMIFSPIVLVDWILILLKSEQRRSLEDRLAKTVVIKLPRPEKAPTS